MAKFRLKWTSIKTGNFGYSTHEFTTRAEAKDAAAELNGEPHQTCVYTVEEVLDKKEAAKGD